jgi:hypothetical protein
MKTARAFLLLSSLGLLAGCTPPLSGTYEDVEDSTRWYTFSKWTKSWTSYYDESGSYRVDGDLITLDTGGGLTGEIVSAEELHLHDVPALRVDKPHNVYRRRPETE